MLRLGKNSQHIFQYFLLKIKILIFILSANLATLQPFLATSGYLRTWKVINRFVVLKWCLYSFLTFILFWISFLKLIPFSLLKRVGLICEHCDCFMVIPVTEGFKTFRAVSSSSNKYTNRLWAWNYLCKLHYEIFVAEMKQSGNTGAVLATSVFLII